MSKKEINLMITLDKTKILSLNSIYKAGMVVRGGKYVPYIYKDNAAKQFEVMMHDQLRAVNFSEHMEWLTQTRQFTATFQYIFKSGIGRRDVDNPTKLIQDATTRFLKNELGLTWFDDALFSDVHLYKSIIPGSQHEYVCIKISPSTFNMRFDQIQQPEQALVHVSENQDTKWEKEFKKKAKEKSLKYQLSTTDKKIKDHNTDIFFVDVSSPTWSVDIMDLMDWIYSHKESGFTFYGFIVGTSQEFINRGQQVIDRINEFGISSIKAGWIKTEAEVLDLI